MGGFFSMIRNAVFFTAAAIALSGCQSPKQVYVSDGYVRLPAVKGRPGVAYFTLHGGKAAQTLVSVTSPAVIRSELHESMTGGSMATMKPIANVALAPGATLRFAPGGRHAMLFDINKSIASGSTIPLVFTFSNGERIQYDAPVIAAGDPAPKP